MTTPANDAATQTLKQSLKTIEQALAKQDLGGHAAATLEKRMQALSEEVDHSSDKMVAYKLKRLAESKLVAQAATSKQPRTQYQSTTFQCKSDLDQCLIEASNSLQKAICYALFIRCAVKG